MPSLKELDLVRRTEMKKEEGIQTLISDVQDMVETVASDRNISNSDLRRVLKFLTKVVQVVDQAFEDVYTTLIDFKFLTAKDITSGRLNDLRRELVLLHARDRYRDAEQICSRLHGLSEQYEQHIAPIVAHLKTSPKWYLLFDLLDEHEGRIIGMVDGAIMQLDRMLRRVDETSLISIRQTATEKADAIRMSLVDLRSLKDQILGLSGVPGLMELTEIDRSSFERQVIIMGDIFSGNTNIGGIQNLGKFNDVINSLNAAGQKELADALTALKEVVLASKHLTDDKKQEQLEVISDIGEEATKPKPNRTKIKMLGDGLLATLKAIPDVAQAVGSIAPILLKFIS